MSVVFPKTLDGSVDLVAMREAIARGEVWDWSAVESADEGVVRALLAGFDLSRDADALGLDTVPESLVECMLASFENSETAEVPAPQGVVHAAPAVWTMEADAPRARRSTSVSPPVRAGDEAVPLIAAPDAFTLRDQLEALVVKDLHGPAGGDEEEVGPFDVPIYRYLLGTLAPQRRGGSMEEDAGTEEELGVETRGAEDGPVEAPAPAASVFPSSLGMSFTVLQRSPTLRVTARWGRYERVRSRVLPAKDEKDPPLVWRRVPMEGSVDIPLQVGPIASVVVNDTQPGVVVRGLVRRRDRDWIVTLFLVNQQEEQKKLRDAAWIFQAELEVCSADGRAIFGQRRQVRDTVRRDPVTDAEDSAMEMLHREHVEFAVGHGVSVEADTSPGDPRWALRLRTQSVPRYEVPQQTPPDAKEIESLDGLVVDMRELATLPDEAVLASLAKLPEAYAQWIASERARTEDPAEGITGYFEHVAASAMDRCEAALARIREGIETLAAQPDAMTAFRFANEAMWQQRVHALLAEECRKGTPRTLAEVDLPRNRSWYAFQLAFLLVNLPSLARLDHPDRTEGANATADLLWFPTGGGKTEAYLGLTAFTLAIRRLQGEVAGRDGRHGVAVLMRYTLRLLTLQQFQRATALICACEVIRRQNPSRWGEEPFRLGLWVGQKTTPNTTEQAREWLLQAKDMKAWSGGGTGSPHQLTSCPWCGTTIVPGRHIRVDPFGKGAARTLMFCGDDSGACDFTERRSPSEGIPALVVDEEIYRRLPSLLIATVDKFAQMPWNGVTQTLFGVITGRCTRHGFRSPDLDDSDHHPKSGALPPARTERSPWLRPPDLIIQDELHLISGPLGTIVGLYETAIDRLCSWDVNGRRVQPKIIASTATVRRAREQVRALFLREVAVFPPHGLDAGDNFFSRQRRPSARHPGRRYLGVCAPGRRMKAVLIRVYTALLAAAQVLYERYDRAADPWMTLVGYFSSMRELAGMRRLVDDDVRVRLRDMAARGLARRPPPVVEELTSRKNSTDIPALLDRLETVFDRAHDAERRESRKKNVRSQYGAPPFDVLLATNMIAVGVDVKRLGLMVTAGQPKNTSEYIQATSRVGRRVPGLVVTVYNWARPRDLSHYERFRHYHATYYAQVEALSVTPFAPRALDRGLTGVLVSLLRAMETTLNANDRAELLDVDHPLVREAVATIVRRAGLVAQTREVETLVRDLLQVRLDAWRAEASRKGLGTKLGYDGEKDGRTRALLHRAGLTPWDAFTCLNSLRDVEPTVGLILDESPLDDVPGAEVVHTAEVSA